MFDWVPINAMLPPLVTGLYAAALAILFVALSVSALRMRRKLRIRLGDAGDPNMLRAMRVHANFAEYVPICLGLIFLAEVQAAPIWLIHCLGISLLTARLSHAYGLKQVEEETKFRVFGVALTLTTLLTSSSFLIVIHFS